MNLREDSISSLELFFYMWSTIKREGVILLNNNETGLHSACDFYKMCLMFGECVSLKEVAGEFLKIYPPNTEQPYVKEYTLFDIERIDGNRVWYKIKQKRIKGNK